MTDEETEVKPITTYNTNNVDFDWFTFWIGAGVFTWVFARWLWPMFQNGSC